MNSFFQMKLIFALGACLLCLGLFKPAQADEVHEYIANIGKRCLTDSMTEKDIEATLENSTPSHEGKCFIACTMKELQVISEDGKFNSDGLVKLSEQVHAKGFNSDDATRLGEVIADKCGSLKGEDECETAFKIYRCGKAEYEASRE